MDTFFKRYSFGIGGAAEPVNEFETPGGLRLLTHVLCGAEEFGGIDPRRGGQGGGYRRVSDEAIRPREVGGREDHRPLRASGLRASVVHVVRRVEAECRCSVLYQGKKSA